MQAFDSVTHFVVLFVPEMGGGPMGVTEKEEKKKEKDWSCSILLVEYISSAKIKIGRKKLLYISNC